MEPRLLEIDSGVSWLADLYLPPYPTMLSIGFMLAIYLAYRWSDRHGMRKSKMIDFGILMVIWGLVGSKALHIIADGHFWDYVNICIDPSKVEWQVDVTECTALKGAWDEAAGVCHPVAGDCFAWAWGGGFAYYGGLIAAALFSVYYIRRQGWSIPRMCDMGGWAITLGLVWGRMGCFLAGCCFGAHDEGPLSVVFPPGSPASRAQWKEGLLHTYRVDSLPVLPTQIFESASCLVIAAFAYFVVRPRKRFDGQVFVFAMVLYAIVRFLLEFIRRDERGGLIGLSTSQLIALGMIVVCTWAWFRFKRMSQAAATKTN